MGCERSPSDQSQHKRVERMFFEPGPQCCWKERAELES